MTDSPTSAPSHGRTPGIVLGLAFKSLLNRRLTAILTLLSVAMSVALLVGVERVRTEAKASFANTISGADLIVGARGGPLNLVLYSIFRMGDATNNISWESYQAIARRPEVAWTIPLSLGDAHRGFRVLGTDANYFQHYRFGAGRPLEFAQGTMFDDATGAVLGAEVATTLGYRIGEEIVVSHGIGDVSFEHHDDAPLRVVGVLAHTGTPVDRTVHVSLAAITRMHDEGGHVESEHGEHGHGEPEHHEAGDEPEHDEPGHDESDPHESGHNEAAHDESEHDEHGHERGHNESAHDEPEHHEPGHDEPDHHEPGHSESGHDENGRHEPGHESDHHEQGHHEPDHHEPSHEESHHDEPGHHEPEHDESDRHDKAHGEHEHDAPAHDHADAHDHAPDAITACIVGLRARPMLLGFQRFVNEYPQEPLLAAVPGVVLQQLWELVAVAELALFAVSAFVVLAGLVGMLTMLLASVAERRREMAVLRAVGAGRGLVFSLLVTEAAVLAGSAAIVGVAVVHAATRLARDALLERFSLALTAQWPTVFELAVIVAVALTGALAAALPAWRLYRFSLADGLSVRT